MAKARRNVKTHPKPQGDDDAQDGYMPPDRQDQPQRGVDEGRKETIDVFGKQTVTVDDQAAGDGAVDLDSAIEGDARTMSSEEDGGGEDGDGQVVTRPSRRDSDAQRQSSDEDGTYSAKVRKRIARERALVNRERALREQRETQLAEERSARQATEERLGRLERAQTEVAANADVKAIQAEIDKLIPQIAAATEAGNTAQALSLQVKLGDLQGDLKLLKYDLQRKQREAEAAAAQRRTTRASPAVESTSDINPEAAALAEQFKKANRHWWNRSANKEAKEDAVTIDREILEEIRTGELEFEPYSDEHWEEVARRLHQSYPQLEIQDLDGQPYNFDDEEGDDDMNERRNGSNSRQRDDRRQQTGRRGPAPVNRMGQNGRKAPNEAELARQGKVTLDQDDFNTMRLFKLDPNDANAKKYFAKEKMRSILSGTRGPNSGGDRR